MKAGSRSLTQGASDGPFRTQAGLTLLEVGMSVVIAGILGAIALGSLHAYGTRNRVKRETGRLVAGFWELRSLAVNGHASPCIDFPDRQSYRLYHDKDMPRDGFDAGDQLIETVPLAKGISILELKGGAMPRNFVCYESKGIVGSATVPLRLRLGSAASGDTKVVEVLPATGIAKVQ